jgi:hypothetical protein
VVESPGFFYQDNYSKRAAMQFIQKNCRQFKVFIVHDARELAQGKGEQLIKVLTSFMRQFKHSGTNKFVLQNSVTPLFLRYDEQDSSE